MKKHYLFIVEGPHDAALIRKILKHKKWAKYVDDPEKVSDIWHSTFPSKYPFNKLKLDRIVPVPEFCESDELSVATMVAGGDSKLVDCLYGLLRVMKLESLRHIEKIMIIMDADKKKADGKILEIKKKISEENTMEYSDEQIALKGIPISIGVFFYCFPNNKDEGNLESILLKCADIEYSEWLQLASTYIDEATKIQNEDADISSGSNRNKAIVGCIANVMKPGKANQISIGDNNWITDEVISRVEEIKQLTIEIGHFLEISE